MPQLFDATSRRQLGGRSSCGRRPHHREKVRQECTDVAGGVTKPTMHAAALARYDNMITDMPNSSERGQRRCPQVQVDE
jgi:hypothetical protein